MEKNNPISKIVGKAEDAYNSIKKAYTDKVSKGQIGDTKILSIEPTETTGGSISKVEPENGRNKYRLAFYTQALDKLKDSENTVETPLGNFEYGMDGGIFRAAYESPFQKYSYGASEPEGIYPLGQVPKNNSGKGFKTDPSLEDYFIDFRQETTPNGFKDYSARAESPHVNLPDIDATFNTPLGSLSLGSMSRKSEDDWAKVYADFLSNEKLANTYNALVNSIKKQKYLNSKGTEL